MGMADDIRQFIKAADQAKQDAGLKVMSLMNAQSEAESGVRSHQEGSPEFKKADAELAEAQRAMQKASAVSHSAHMVATMLRDVVVHAEIMES